MPLPLRPDPKTRADLAEWAKTLRDSGWAYEKIGRELEVSARYAAVLYNDPDGSKDRARKASYGGRCACGARTTGSDGRAKTPTVCFRCAQRKQSEERFWTRERIVESFQTFARIVGRPPAVADSPLSRAPSQVIRLSPTRLSEIEEAEAKMKAAGYRLPHATVINREFGGWRPALRAAGLSDRAVGGAPSHRETLANHRLRTEARACAVCEKSFETAKANHLYCGVVCRRRAAYLRSRPPSRTPRLRLVG